MSVALDPGECRPLSTREIARVLRGIITVVVLHDPPSSAAMPAVLDKLRYGSPVDYKTLDWLADPDAHAATWATALGATVNGLRGWCKPDDVAIALSWVAENLHDICDVRSVH